MLHLFSERAELAADRAGELARLGSKPQGSLVFPTVCQRVVLKLVHMLWKGCSVLLSPLEL